MQRLSPYRPLGATQRPVLLRPFLDRRHRLFARRTWDPFNFDKTEGNEMPFDYDTKKLQEFDDLMPSSFEPYTLPDSKIQLKRLLEKNGVRCGATFGTDFDERLLDPEARQKRSLGTRSEARLNSDDFFTGEPTDEDDKNEAWLGEEISADEAYFMQTIEFGHECMLEKEAEDIFEKAMELHHSQRARSRNIYATCSWYAKKLHMAELQNSYEIDDPNPIPPYVRAFYTLEDEFEQLNAQQIVEEQKCSEQVQEMIEEEFREFLKSQVVTMPTKPGDKYYDIFAPKDKKEVKKNEEDEEEEEQEEMDSEIDVFLHGILPNAAIDKGVPASVVKSKDAFLHELVFKEDEAD